MNVSGALTIVLFLALYGFLCGCLSSFVDTVPLIVIYHQINLPISHGFLPIYRLITICRELRGGGGGKYVRV